METSSAIAHIKKNKNSLYGEKSPLLWNNIDTITNANDYAIITAVQVSINEQLFTLHANSHENKEVFM